MNTNTKNSFTQTKFAVKTELSSCRIVDVVRQIDDEELGLPYFQRDFLWSNRLTALLWDSLWKGYALPPIGISNANHDSFNALLPYKFGKDSITQYSSSRTRLVPKAANTNIVLDGQQRVQTIYGLLAGTWGSSNKVATISLQPSSEGETSRVKWAVTQNSSGFPWVSLPWLFAIMRPDNGHRFSVDDVIKTIEENHGEQISDRALLRSQIQHFADLVFQKKRIDFVSYEDTTASHLFELYIRMNSNHRELSIIEQVEAFIRSTWPEYDLRMLQLYNDVCRCLRWGSPSSVVPTKWRDLIVKCFWGAFFHSSYSLKDERIKDGTFTRLIYANWDALVQTLLSLCNNLSRLALLPTDIVSRVGSTSKLNSLVISIVGWLWRQLHFDKQRDVRTYSSVVRSILSDKNCARIRTFVWMAGLHYWYRRTINDVARMVSIINSTKTSSKFPIGDMITQFGEQNLVLRHNKIATRASFAPFDRMVALGLIEENATFERKWDKLLRLANEQRK